MKISYKLWLGFGLLILLFGGVGVYLNVHLGQLGKSTLAIFEQPLKVVDQSRSAWDLFRTSRQHVTTELARIQFTDAHKAAITLKDYAQQFKEHLEQAEIAGKSMKVDVNFNELQQLSDRWYQLNLLRIGPASQTHLPDERSLTQLEQQLERQLGLLISQSFLAVERYRAKTADQVEQTQLISNALLVAALIFAIAIAVYLALSLTSPLKKLALAVESLSSGDADLTQRINSTRGDEIGVLAQQVDKFIGVIHQLVIATQKSLHDASSGVQDVAVLADQSKIGAANQKDGLHNTAELVGINKEGIAAVNISTHSAQIKVEEIAQQTNQGRELVQNTTESITQLATQVGNAGETVQQLANESNNITSLLKVIEEIADQTNLLALNAAIEAARAGDAGRGFAVVAEEVRALSKKTRDSTQDIQKTILGIQEHVASTHKVMIEGSELAKICVSQADSVNGALHEISGNVQTIVSMTDSISQEMEQQQSGMEQIDNQMFSVSELADDNAQSADSLQIQAKQMDVALQEVNLRLSQFKI